MAQAMAFFCVYFKELNCYGFFRKEEEGEKGAAVSARANGGEIVSLHNIHYQN
jgi:hypothetical protein